MSTVTMKWVTLAVIKHSVFFTQIFFKPLNVSTCSKIFFSRIGWYSMRKMHLSYLWLIEIQPISAPDFKKLRPGLDLFRSKSCRSQFLAALILWALKILQPLSHCAFFGIILWHPHKMSPYWAQKCTVWNPLYGI